VGLLVLQCSGNGKCLGSKCELFAELGQAKCSVVVDSCGAVSVAVQQEL
jgi:hypothetical protein